MSSPRIFRGPLPEIKLYSPRGARFAVIGRTRRQSTVATFVVEVGVISPIDWSASLSDD